MEQNIISFFTLYLYITTLKLLCTVYLFIYDVILENLYSLYILSYTYNHYIYIYLLIYKIVYRIDIIFI